MRVNNAMGEEEKKAFHEARRMKNKPVLVRCNNRKID